MAFMREVGVIFLLTIILERDVKPRGIHIPGIGLIPEILMLG